VNRAFGDDIVEWTVLGAAGDYSGLDRFNRILDLLVKNTNNGLVINSYQYTYDFDSRILRRENSAPGSSAYLFDEGFTYDSLGRLTDNKRGDWTGADWYTLSNHECSTLDRSGNKTSYYSGPSTACGTTWTATYNASNEITAGGPYPSYEYLYDGNMTRIGSKVYEYDAWNRLSQVWSDQVGWFISVYDYNGLHQKISRLEASLPDTSYYYSLEGRVIEERDFWTGSVQRNYVWGTQQIDDLVLRDVSTPTYYVSDANFNVVTSFDSSAAVLERFAYGAFGEPKKYDAQWGSGAVITEDLYLFTGRQWHKEHSQYDYRSRSYDPQMGRFLQRDPILSGCDDSFGNAYPMTANDPVNFRDPSGTSKEERARFIDAFIRRLNELNRQFMCGEITWGEFRELQRSLSGFADEFLNGGLAAAQQGGGAAGQGAGQQGAPAPAIAPSCSGPEGFSGQTLPIRVSFVLLAGATDTINRDIAVANSIYSACCIQIVRANVLALGPEETHTILGKLGNSDTLDDGAFAIEDGKITPINNFTEEVLELVHHPQGIQGLRTYYVPRATSHFVGKSFPYNAETNIHNSMLINSQRIPSARTFAHELGHILMYGGLGEAHSTNPAHLMFGGTPPGATITPQQCQAARAGVVTQWGLP
jgi:RHS repeat-associated protein